MFLLVGWISLAAHATPIAVEMSHADAGVSLAGAMGYRVDETGQLTLKEVRSRSGLDQFIFPDKPVVRGGDPRPVWFLIRVFQSGSNGDWVLSTRSTSVQDMQFYGPFDASGKTRDAPVLTGALLPFETRPLASEALSVRLQLSEPGEYTLYVRALALTPQTYDFRMYDIEKFYASWQDKRIFDGICYGIMLAMLVYNLVLLLVFRDATFALYVLSGGFALLTLVSFNGHASHYLFPNWPVFANRLNVIVPALWIFFGALFANSFLDLKRYAPVVAKMVLAMAVLALGAALLGAVGQQTLAQTANEHISLLGTAVIFAGAAISWYRGFLPARWYIGGQFALFSTVILSIMVNWGYLYWPFIDDNGLQIGVAVEVMVFAVALSSRIRMMQSMQTELTQRTERLTVASETDPLTGVANRAGLAHQASSILRHPFERTLILLDLDKFKPVNDLYGHEAGDAVLVEVARRIKAEVRAEDTVARVGGDEFVVLLNQSYERKVLELISRRLLDAVAQPVAYSDKQLLVGGSLGIARYPGNGLTLPDLMQAADVAMYHVKKHGRDGFAFFEDLSEADAQVAAPTVAGRPPVVAAARHPQG
jgi:diguanylate cyclase (GGDEF)-like protein